LRIKWYENPKYPIVVFSILNKPSPMSTALCSMNMSVEELDRLITELAEMYSLMKDAEVKEA